MGDEESREGGGVEAWWEIVMVGDGIIGDGIIGDGMVGDWDLGFGGWGGWEWLGCVCMGDGITTSI